MKKTLIVSFMLSYLVSVGAYATANHSHTAIGEPGVQENITRTIRLEVYEYRFSPSEINIKQGETVRFIVKNTGKKKHEMMIDTIQHLREHEKMMREHDHEAHTEPNQIILEPGEEKELIWYFTQAGTIDFACPVPGHFKGMRGKIIVENK